MLTLTACIAAALAFGSVPTAETPPVGAAGDFPFEPGPNLPALHAQVSSETRDEPWASEAEATLQRLYDGLNGRAAARTLEITCAATLCEVFGELRTDVAADEREALVLALQDHPVVGTIAEVKLTKISNAFSGADPSRDVFVAYWERSTNR